MKFLPVIMLFAALLVSSVAGAQVKVEETIFDEATVVYHRAMFGGVILHTNGWGAHFTYGTSKTAFKFRIYQLEVVGMKHPKEIKVYSPRTFDNSARSFVLGKINNFFIIRPTFGIRHMKYDKIRKSGVSVGWTYRIGPSLGFTKPIYMELDDANDGGGSYVERYDPNIHPVSDILGRASGLKGFGELQIQPGVHGAFALNFEYDAERTGIKGIEVGTTADFYPLGEIEIMSSDYATNSQLFFNFYVCVQFGKKFNR